MQGDDPPWRQVRITCALPILSVVFRVTEQVCDVAALHECSIHDHFAAASAVPYIDGKKNTLQVREVSRQAGRYRYVSIGRTIGKIWVSFVETKLSFSQLFRQIYLANYACGC